MGKKILVQRRGRGTSRFRASTHKRVSKVRYPKLQEKILNDKITARVIDLIHEPGRGTPLAKLLYDDGMVGYAIANEGMWVGQVIEIGKKASINEGNVLFLRDIPEGTPVFNVEMRPGDGGKLIRTSGGFGTVVSKDSKIARIKLSSGRIKAILLDSRATIGIVAAGGRIEMPFLKAGKKRAWMKAKGRVYPRVRGVAMNAVSHPFGSKSGDHNKPTTVSRGAPPGRKVGLIAARRTGKKQGKSRRAENK